MTAPWTPAPNPGGRNREFMRKIVTQWIVDAQIPGLVTVYPGTPMEKIYDAETGNIYTCLGSVHIRDVDESFQVLTGPDDHGGYFARYSVELTLDHRCSSVDRRNWWLAEDDHDRILDACKDRLKGDGRALGRPDVVLQSAAWPREGSIAATTDEPLYNGGQRDQRSQVFFTVTQYMQRQP